ncbi:hypothetical protein chiPu_0019488 [Chiloscyllium punctatum]|uniref:RING-type E3 ubiquitin transferase n=1 Tax=Chiloscyllium punctatum TaxID=137246 RepID=A0A401RS19_CHIPU|nr:hypothetical protein [Chiloscyllium punctatum]
MRSGKALCAPRRLSFVSLLSEEQLHQEAAEALMVLSYSPTPASSQAPSSGQRHQDGSLPQPPAPSPPSASHGHSQSMSTTTVGGGGLIGSMAPPAVSLDCAVVTPAEGAEIRLQADPLESCNMNGSREPTGPGTPCWNLASAPLVEMAQCLSDDKDEGDKRNVLGVELTCGVCMGFYQDPVRLPCEHSFCKVCIDQVFENVEPESDYRCPICRKSYQSKPKMTKHLVLVRLVEAYNEMMHGKVRPASLEKVEDSHTAVESSLGGRTCRIHSGEELTHLCFKDWELLCPLCVSNDHHVNHTATPLVQVTEDWKKMLPNIVESLEENHAKLSVQVMQYAELEEKANVEIADAKDRAEGQIDRLIEFLQNEKERLMIDMQHVGNDHLDSIHGLQAQATHRLEHCEDTIQSFREASRLRDNFEFVRGMMEFMQRMETLIISPDDDIVQPSLNFDGIPLPSVLQAWKNEDLEEEGEGEEEEEEEDDNEDELSCLLPAHSEDLDDILIKNGRSGKVAHATFIKDQFKDIAHHFSKDEWAELSEWEKTRYKNVKRNYEAMLAIGLNVPKPAFMSRHGRGNRPCVYESSDSDEDWTPKCLVKNPLQVRTFKPSFKNDGTKKTKKENSKKNEKRQLAIASHLQEDKDADLRSFSEDTPSVLEETVSVKKINQETNTAMSEFEAQEESIKVCEDCETFFVEECPAHGPPVFIKDTVVEFNQPDRARLTLPEGLSIAISKIRKAGLGVWNEGKAIPKGVHFGPYEGVTSTEESAAVSGYSWVISKGKQDFEYIDAKDESKSNWMR